MDDTLGDIIKDSGSDQNRDEASGDGASGAAEMWHGLRFARYQFTLKSVSGMILGTFMGSVLRGAFGGTFRRLVCVSHRMTSQPVCERCRLRNACPYGYLFETAPPPDSLRLRKNQDVPHPFIFEPPLSAMPYYAPGKELTFHLLLVGKAVEYLPYFIFAFLELERCGLGQRRRHDAGRFELRRVVADLGQNRLSPVYEREQEILQDAPIALQAADMLAQQVAALSPHTLTLHFLTPTRLRFEGQLTTDIEFHHVVRVLLRRLSNLMYFHCGAELKLDFRQLIERAQHIKKVSAGLRWREQTRYSARQREELQMGGFVGRVTFQGDLTPFLTCLVAGQWLHVGKGCVMGLGRYEIETPPTEALEIEPGNRGLFEALPVACG